MTGEEIATILTEKLSKLGFVVHRYNAVTTSSIYLKLDYGVCCGIRIADHDGRKRYHYRFNVIKNYKGDGLSKEMALFLIFLITQSLKMLLIWFKVKKLIKFIDMVKRTI